MGHGLYLFLGKKKLGGCQQPLQALFNVLDLNLNQKD